MNAAATNKPTEKFSILVSNGYSLEWEAEVEAVSAKQARAIYLKREAGTFKADMIRRNPKKMRAVKVQ